jgi:hypothetical protein
VGRYAALSGASSAEEKQHSRGPQDCALHTSREIVARFGAHALSAARAGIRSRGKKLPVSD